MLLIERRGHILLLTLNRPEKRNSLHPDLINQLSSALGPAGARDDTRVVVITGTPPAFCSGLDLHHLAYLDEAGRVDYMRRAFALFRKIYELRQPVLAAVNGPAMAGGFDLAAFCDLRFCATDACFAQPEILLGLTQIIYPVYKLVGLGRAKELAMTGDVITAEEAFRIGFVNRVYSPDHLLPEVLRVAAALTERPPEALYDTKRLSRQVVEMSTESAFNQMFDVIATRLQSREHIESLASYLLSLKQRRAEAEK